MLFLGQATTSVPTSGQYINSELRITYPVNNPSSYNGKDQPTDPPIELQAIEIRYTDDSLCLTNPDDSSIKWKHHSKGCPEVTATYNEELERWEGLEDKIIIPNKPIKGVYYYQNRTLSRGGVHSDWSPAYRVIDNPEPLPVPEITSIKTNAKDQVLLEWLDVGVDISSFETYEIAIIEQDTSARLETNALIVGSE